MTLEVNLYADAGVDFSYPFQILDASKIPVNITGKTIRASIKKDYDSATSTPFTVAVNDATNGKITLSLSAAQTTALTQGNFYFDCLLVGTTTTKFLKGILIVAPTVS